MLLAALDWNQLVVALITAIPAYLAAYWGRGANRHARDVKREIETPSGDTLGAVAERTHELAAVTAAGVRDFADGATAARVDRAVAALERIADQAQGQAA